MHASISTYGVTHISIILFTNEYRMHTYLYAINRCSSSLVGIPGSWLYLFISAGRVGTSVSLRLGKQINIYFNEIKQI